MGRAYRPPPDDLGDQVGEESDRLHGVARERHRGIPSLRETVNSLKWLEEETIIYFQASARRYRLEMNSILGEE